MASYFDEKAQTWDDDPAKVQRARSVADAIRAAVPLDRSTRLFEYGAGTGLVAQALADHVGPLTLAEPSEGMRAVMADKVARGALPGDARIRNLDLSTDEVPDERYDLVVTVMTLHHIPALQPVLDAFAVLLSGGGHLCVADLEEEDGSFHSHEPTFEGHDGLARADLARRLETAGFVEVDFEPCGHVEKEGRVYPLFLATGRRGHERAPRRS